MTNELNALLGKGSEFQGKLTFEGTVRIDGRFTGEIFSDGVLIIGEGAEVQAEIRVAAVQVWGLVTGNVTATEAVELHAPAELRGNITSPALHIDKGVYFDGACQMTSGKPERPTLATVPQPLPSQLPRITSPRPLGQTTGSHQMATPSAIAAPSAMAAGTRQTGSGIFLPEPTRQTGELTHKF
ncbi:MAG: polymer-forming cytoskeletal protein [Myxococcales bacterium]|nr:polymer-forming cytoskeletal protein [Myxococcales bacterium]